MKNQSVLFVTVRQGYVLNPLVMLLVPWLVGCAGFLFQWTTLRLYPFWDVFEVVAIVLVPFVVTFSGLSLSENAMSKFVAFPRQRLLSVPVSVIWRRVRFFFFVWFCISVLEIYLSRGVPIVWLLTGSTLTYMDFGIHSLHGLMNSILLVCSLVSMLLFYSTKEKVYLIIPILSFIWGVIVISRALILSNLLQVLILYMYIFGLDFRKLRLVSLALIIFIVAFGIIGDMRSGEFNDFVGAAGRFPNYLPSGFLWVYVYMVTPLNNLVNTFMWVDPLFSPVFPNTISLLFPSVIRGLLFDLDVGKGNLVVEAFNISTGFIGPYKDFGVLGVMLLSMFYAFISFFSWRSSTLHGMLIYVVIAHCLLVSIFFNWFFFLPVVFQFFWLYFILYKVRFV